jgi:hypothetical protein
MTSITLTELLALSRPIVDILHLTKEIDEDINLLLNIAPKWWFRGDYDPNPDESLFSSVEFLRHYANNRIQWEYFRGGKIF